MTATISRSWWDQSFVEQGPKAMDKLLSADSGWPEVLASGEADLAPALKIAGLTTGQDRSVLDIGCGIGRLTHALGLRYGRAVGVDISPNLIASAEEHRQLPNVSFVVSDGQRLLPPAPQSFDSIFSYEVLYYVPAAPLAGYFREAFELLKPAGEFVFHLNVEPIQPITRLSHRFRDLLFYCGIPTWRSWSNHPDFRRLYHAPSWVCNELTQAGFEVQTPRGTPRQMWFRAVKPQTQS